MTDKEKLEQMINLYEYERAYKLSKNRIIDKIEKARKIMNELFDDIIKDTEGMMDTARCLKHGGVSCGKVWNLYSNNPDITDLQSTIEHFKHLKQSGYPFKKIIETLESDK